MSIKGITIHADDHAQFFKRSLVLYFTNGYKMSIIYGTGAYSNTLSGTRHSPKPDDRGTAEPEAAFVEVAILDPHDAFVPFRESGDDVRGNTDFDTVLKIANWVDTLPTRTNA